MILIIDNYDSFTYNLYQAIAKVYPNVIVKRNDQITIEEIQALPTLKGIILSPGPGRPEDAGICVDLIQSLKANLPLLGVCLGHQAIGQAFGASVIHAPAVFHGKEDQVFHHRRDLYQHLSLPLIVGRYHSLVVDTKTLPECLMIEAENADGLMMGMRHRERPIYGVQFHPESILTPQGEKLLNNFLTICGVL